MAVTGGEPISAANLSAAIAAAVQSAVAQATAGAKTYTDAAVQQLRDEMDDIANTFYSCNVRCVYHTSPRYFSVEKQREQSNGGVSVSYNGDAHNVSSASVQATVTTTTAGSYDISVRGERIGRYYGGPGTNYQFYIDPPSDFLYDSGDYYEAAVFIERIA